MTILTINPVPYIIIAIIVIIIIIIVSLFNNKNKETAYTTFKNNIKELGYEITEVNNEPYHLIIKNDQVTFLAKLIEIPQYAEIQVNNNITWEIKYGAGNTPGKPQPYSKYLKDISSFVKLQPENNEIKLVIASPAPKKITKWINECEIIFVTPYTDVYSTRIISYKDYRIFKNPFNIKNEDEE